MKTQLLSIVSEISIQSIFEEYKGWIILVASILVLCLFFRPILQLMGVVIVPPSGTSPPAASTLKPTGGSGCTGCTVARAREGARSRSALFALTLLVLGALRARCRSR